MNTYLLDTNILVGIIRGSEYAAYTVKKFDLFNPQNISLISIVTRAEIYSFAIKRNWGSNKIQIMSEIINKIPSINIDSIQLIEAFAQIDSFNLGKHPTKKLTQGMSARNIQDNDIWIAATANVLNATLLSTDKHFEHLNNVFIDFVYIDQNLKENDAI